MTNKPSKFIRGDLVRIADDLGSSMEHFTKSRDAIIKERSSDHNDSFEYEIWLLPEFSSCAWYHHNQLKDLGLNIGERGIEDLKQIKKDEKKRHGDLRHIVKWFQNPNNGKRNIPYETGTELGRRIGIPRPWDDGVRLTLPDGSKHDMLGVRYAMTMMHDVLHESYSATVNWLVKHYPDHNRDLL